MKEKQEKSMMDELNDIKTPKKNEENDVLLFLVGIVLLVAGLFMLSKRVFVHTGWYTFHFGGFDLSSGTVIIPLIIGIIWLFYNSKSIWPKMIILLSAICMILSVIMSTRITLVPTSMFDYILIFGLAAAGAGLVLRTMFKKK